MALDGVDGDLYLAARSSRGIVLVPGAAERGRNDPRVIRLARAFARARRTVFVPELELYSRRLVSADLDRLVMAIHGLGARVGRPVTVVGFSYGGSYALVAAADPRVRGGIDRVAVFGAYFDLVGVVQALTTGVSLIGGRSLPWPSADRARAMVPQIAAALAPPGEAATIRAALDGRLDPSELHGEGRSVFELLANREPGKTALLAEQVAPHVRDLLRRLSPASVASAIRIPVFAMHALEDPAVPYGEALRFVRGLPRTRLVTVRGFDHVDFEAAGSWRSVAADLVGAWRFAAWALGA